MFSLPKVHKTYAYKKCNIGGKPCIVWGCSKLLTSPDGLLRHLRVKHGGDFTFALASPSQSEDEHNLEVEEEMPFIPSDNGDPLPFFDLDQDEGEC